MNGGSKFIGEKYLGQETLKTLSKEEKKQTKLLDVWVSCGH